jgi:glycosyltransferase involved in cell wall biosynthesis
MDVSVVIPMFNEEESLPELHERLVEVLEGLGKTFEVLFVDDGSTDRSSQVAQELREKDQRVGLVRFRRNFGKAAALDAGFKRARGDIVFTMDADLQDDPKEIPRFLEKLDEGYDLVSGWKRKRHDPLGKTLPSKFFNFTVSTVSGLKLKDFNCGFKAYRREAIEGLSLYGELHRFIPVLVFWRGFAVAQITVEHHARKHGVSKYGVERMIKGAFDLLTVLLMTRFRTRPLHLFGGLGLLTAFIGLVPLAYLSVVRLFIGGTIQRPLLFFGLLAVMVGVQMITTGLLGEMIHASRSDGEVGYRIREAITPQLEPALTSLAGGKDDDAATKVPAADEKPAAASADG